MVTCNVDAISVSKMNSVRARKPASSNSSGFRLLDGDHLESTSSVSRNSVYKLKIDLMFDDSRSVHSNRLDDPRGSHRTRSIIMYGRSELASTAGESARSLASFIQETSQVATNLHNSDTKKDMQRVSNSVQAQIEQLFTDVAKDATSTFDVTCLGSLPLKDKVTSLQGLQEPLKELYLKEIVDERNICGSLDICASGLRVRQSFNETKTNNNNANPDGNIIPFHNIAVWSAVKFVIADNEESASFLPLITDPENIDKTSLFQPLSSTERQQLLKQKSHSPIFAVVMRSSGAPKVLECHAFICKTTEDAIVIAATLYQSLMAHVSSNSHRSTKKRTPRNQNGVSCISIASSSAVTGSNYTSQIVSSGRKGSIRSSSGGSNGNAATSRSSRKKRVSNSSLSSSSNVINEAVETTTEERKRVSHKTKRAPPVPTLANVPNISTKSRKDTVDAIKSTHATKHADSVYRTSSGGLIGNGGNIVVPAGNIPNSSSSAACATGLRSNDMNGDILTRVAIPRSGSFLNTGGLTRYKSRAARRHTDKLGGGGGGGSPLGFSELFNEFRLQENLNSLDEILNAIIDADGMSFNDLKPIYKEFLLKLAVTLTKDELFQRSKNIMRRQRKKKLKRKLYATNGSQKKPKPLVFSAKALKKVFQFGQFRACRGKQPKLPRNRVLEMNQRKARRSLTIGPPTNSHTTQHQRSRVATSGSDVSLVRNDNGFNGPHRNSSSGYVSCSECSYDSESCTCSSADRCYCSLGAEKRINNSSHNNSNQKLRRKSERKNTSVTAASSKKSNSNPSRNDSNYNSSSIANRSSYISCKSDDKCYCSMVEEEPTLPNNDDIETSSHSDTTWCDSDSCVSASKCYCKRSEQRAKRRSARNPQAMLNVTSDSERSQKRSSRALSRKATDKLALDYELFTISGSGKSVQPHEALSVKKSVEAAAIFADVKLNQTTDIKTLCGTGTKKTAPLTTINGHIKSVEKLTANKNLKNREGSRSYSAATSIKRYAATRQGSDSIDRKNKRNSLNALSSSSSQKSCSADDLLSKLSAIEKTAAFNKHEIYSLKESFHVSNYQCMRATSASLEDTLGYLP